MKKKTIFVAVVLLSVLLLSCSAGNNGAISVFYSENDLKDELGINVTFPDADGIISLPKYEKHEDTDGKENIDVEEAEKDGIVYRMKVCEGMDIYSSANTLNYVKKLTDGENILLKPLPEGTWTEVYDLFGELIGYTEGGFRSSYDADGALYATLPIEYGMAKNNQENLIPAYSHLVDVRRYFRVYSSTEALEGKADFSLYDMVVAMQLSTEKTTINEPFYNSNIALVQYDILPKIAKAIQMFRNDGYIMVICDAYRPTSVQQRWFDVVGVHMWVADPSIGMGGIHDRGTALDITLIDRNGNELEFPTPMHTFTADSARTSPNMSETAKKNMDYMLDVMVKCGFTYINSEWWHFQDENTQNYLPTDHSLDEVPLVPSEKNELGTVKVY